MDNRLDNIEEALERIEYKMDLMMMALDELIPDDAEPMEMDLDGNVYQSIQIDAELKS